jgi:ferredoxin-type protein NapH
MELIFTKTDKTKIIKKYGWIFTLIVAVGGLWYPKLGLLAIPIMATLFILPIFKGKYWCGNFCPHSSLFESLLGSISKNKKIPAFFKSNFLSIAFLLWFGFNLTRKLTKVFSLYGTMQFWDKLGLVFSVNFLMVAVVGGMLSIFISPRTWCSFCPMGTIQKLPYKLGKAIGIAKLTDKKVTISDHDKCLKCGKCSKACPVQLSPHSNFSTNKQFNHEDCIKCSGCIENCPIKILSLVAEHNLNTTK